MAGGITPWRYMFILAMATFLTTSPILSNNGVPIFKDQFIELEECVHPDDLYSEMSPPVVMAVCQDVTLSVDQNGELFVTPELVDGGSDTTGFESWFVSPDEFGCEHVGAGPQVVTLTIIEVTGASSSCIANVTVTDSVLPIALCKDTILYLDINGQASLIATDLDDGSNDNCTAQSDLGLSIDRSDFTCMDLSQFGSFEAYQSDTMTGNQSWRGVLGKDFNVIRPVVITALGAFDDQLDGINGIYNGTSIRVAIVDRNTQMIVPGLDIELSGSGDPIEAGHRMRTIAPIELQPGQYSVLAQGYHSGERNGNNNFPAYIPTSNNNAEGAIAYPPLSRYSPDNCCTFPYPTLTFPDNNVFHAGTFRFETKVGIPVTLSVTDESNNTSECIARVIVEDSIPPMMDCQDVTVNLDEFGQADINIDDIRGATGDICGLADIYLSRDQVDCSDIDETEIQLYAEDVNGNLDSCISVITVLDPIPPIVVCPPSVTISLDSAYCDRIYCYEIEVDDNCPGNVISISGFQYIGDFNGNHYFLSDQALGWEQANQTAAINGGHLVYIETTLESDWLEMNVTPDPMDPEVWIGARYSQQTADFKWNNGGPLSESNWAAGAPGMGPFDRDVVYWQHSGGMGNGWYATSLAGTAKRYLIELEGGRAIQLLAGRAPGNPFPYSANPVRYQITDAGGNVEICSFEVFVEADDQVACTGQNISLDELCEAEVLAEMVLSGQVDCYEVYEVTLVDKNGMPRGNMVGQQDIGQVLEYEVNDVTRGFICSGEVLIEDKFPPILFCRDTVLNCIEMQQYEGPDVVEYCEGMDVRLVSEKITPLNCDDEFVKEIVQGYVAEDAAGNISDTCYQRILIERFPMDSVAFEPLEISLSCDAIPLLDPFGRPHPSLTGVPTLFGAPIYPYNDFLCNVTVGYTDYEAPEVACTREIIRSWEVTEWWCSTKRTRPFIQRILIIDTTGPMLVVPADLTVNTARRSCSASFDLPPAMVDDACHDPVSVSVKYPGGFLTGQNGGRITLPVGVHTVIYTAYDDCYKKTVDSMVVTVRDDNPPVAICEQHLVVALRQDGTASVSALSFDDGSYDPCGLDSIAVRRMTDPCLVPGNTDWGPEVSFCCDDVGAGLVMVGLRILDLGGNEAQCMVSVEVQDKQAPKLIPLPDMTISCEYAIDTTRLFEFGKIALSPADREPILASNMEASFSGPALDGLASDNCAVIVSEDFDLTLDNCGLGLLTRYFTITDPQGFMITDVQYIEIIDRDPFDSTDFVWPEDLDTVGLCNAIQLHPDSLPVPYGRPVITGDDACSLVGMSYEDQVLPVVRGDTACLKIIRFWTIIDWCQKTNGLYKKWEYEQILKFGNEIAPVIVSPCVDTLVCTYDPECGKGYIELIADGLDDCTPADELFWTFQIDLDDDGSIDSSGNASDASGHYDVGTHRIYWFLEDRCGNSTQCDFTFEIRNCKGPVVYCRNGLVAALEPVDTDMDNIPDDEQVVIYTESVDLGSYHGCGYPVTFSFDSVIQKDSVVYNCDSLGTRPLEMWVTDINGNQGSCIINVQLIDTNEVNICVAMNPLVSISGKLSTPKGNLINNADVMLVGSGLPVYRTDNSGFYAFPAMITGGNYQVVPEKLDGVLDGVSTKDLIMIQRHILGISALNDPFAMIAADVNNSGSISAKDLTELRKVILGIQPFFKDNTSWRFVESDYQFPDDTNPWFEKFPEYFDLANLAQDEEVDFTGVKIGDVDQSFSFSGKGIQSRAGSEVVFRLGHMIDDAKMGPVLPVTLYTTTELHGFQLQLNWDNSRNVITGVLPSLDWEKGEGQFNQELIASGKLRTSWMASQDHNMNGKVMFYLTLGVNARGIALPAIELAVNGFSSEAYDRNLNVLPIILEKEIVQQEDLQMDLSPNPWSDLLQLDVEGLEKGSAVLMLFDQNGKQIWRREDRILSDEYQTFIRRQSSWSSGMYHLVLLQGNRTISETVILTQ